VCVQKYFDSWHFSSLVEAHIVDARGAVLRAKKYIQIVRSALAIAGSPTNAMQIARDIFRQKGIGGISAALKRLAYVNLPSSEKGFSGRLVSDYSEQIMKELESVQAVDPRVGLFPIQKRLNQPVYNPLRSNVGALMSDVFYDFKSLEPDVFFWVPDMEIGGASTYAVQVAESISRVNPNLKIVIISTKASTRKYSFNEVSKNIFHATLGHSLNDLEKIDRFKFVYELLSNLQPKVQIVANSDLFYDFAELYLETIQTFSKVGAAFFCPDFDSDGNDRGFSNTYFASLAPRFDFLLTDNETHIREISEEFGIPEVLRKVTYLFTVPESIERPSPYPPRNGPMRISWAGRPGPQKGFETLLEVAKEFTEGQFYVHGIRGREVFLEDVPKNVKFLGPFRSFGDVLENRPDVLVNTSKWDGRQIILLNALVNGLPVVSPLTGGARELINLVPEGAIKIDKESESHSYVQALRRLDQSRGLLKVMAEADKSNLAQAHSVENFDRGVSNLLNRLELNS
jgi:glycosyltransferase involved in cell wall biosynthesis